MGNAFRNCRKAYSPGINLAGKAIAKGSDRPIAIGLRMRKVADHGSGKDKFWGGIFARFAVKESGSKRGEGKEPSRQTTHNETRGNRDDNAGYRCPDTKNGDRTPNY